VGIDPLPDDPLLKEMSAPPASGTAAKDSAAVAKKLDVSDIVVVPRKAFLKTGRVELVPLSGLSVNDSLIRHWGFGGELNYFLTDVFSVGVQGMYFVKELSERQGLIGLQYNRIPTINKFLWTAALNFGYVPLYGKFALFNKHIMHWETFASAGVGMTQTEIIPRKGGAETFKTNAITPNFGLGGRLFLFDWLTINVALRDYVFIDKFEPTNREDGWTIDQVKSEANSELTHNVMLYVGAGFYLPPSFTYRSPR
jgi:outer membrane beta-barrel protein